MRVSSTTGTRNPELGTRIAKIGISQFSTEILD